MGYRYAYHDDPVEEADERKSIGSRILYYFSALAIIAVAGTTFASNISLNSSSTTEFGQGFLATTACSGESSIMMKPTSIFDGANYLVQSVTVSNIPSACAGSDFILNASTASQVANGSTNFAGSVNTQYLTYAPSQAFNFGTGNLTIEGWVYVNNYTSWSASNGDLVELNNGSDAYLIVGINNNGSWRINWHNGNQSGWTTGSASNITPLQTWQHFAAVRNGDNFTLYINGVARATTSGMSGLSFGFADQPLGIGADPTSGGNRPNVKLSNIRIVKGSAVYNFGSTIGTTYFSPPNSALSAISGTQLLLNSTVGASNLVDSSPNAFLPVLHGTPTGDALSPFPGTFTTLPAMVSPLFSSNNTTARIYANGSTFVRGANSSGTTVTTNSIAPTGSFTVSFDSPVAISSTVQNFTLQSQPHS